MTQKATRLLSATLSACVCLAFLGCEKKPQPIAKAVYFVPIGSDLSLNIDGLQSYYKEHYGLEIKTLPAMSIDDTIMDRSRNQIIAERVIDAIQNKYSEARDSDNVLIGLTAKDMYIRQKPDWSWAFSYRGSGRLAVISNARMTPSNYGLPPNQTLLDTRERKFVTKNIGILYYGKPLSDDPKSVLYGKSQVLMTLTAWGKNFDSTTQLTWPTGKWAKHPLPDSAILGDSGRFSSKGAIRGQQDFCSRIFNDLECSPFRSTH